MQQQHCANGFDISLAQQPNGNFCDCFFSVCLQCWQQLIVQTSFFIASWLCTKVPIGWAIRKEK